MQVSGWHALSWPLVATQGALAPPSLTCLLQPAHFSTQLSGCVLHLLARWRHCSALLSGETTERNNEERPLSLRRQRSFFLVLR